MLRDGAAFGAPGESVPGSFGDPAREAASALAGCVLADLSPLGRIRMTGKDRQDFLHRLSTNEISALKPGEGNLTVLLTPKGRILDLLHVLAAEDHLLLITSEGMGEKDRLWLDGYLFREEVAMEEVAALPCLGLYGPGSEPLLSRLAGGEWRELPVAHHRLARIAGHAARVVRTFPLATSGFLVLGEPGSDLALWEAMVGAGASPAGAVALERLRIAAGVPGRGKELTEDYNPWEAGLDAAISLRKGCYLGQEIVARLSTYGKIRRRLVGVRMEGSTLPEPGSPILRGEETLGAVTSSGLAPGSSRALALGLVRTGASGAGVGVSVQSGGERLPGRLSGLPFPQEEG